MPYANVVDGKIVGGLYAGFQPGRAETFVEDSDAMLLPIKKAQLLPDLRTRRDLAMNVLDGLQSDALASGETADALAIKDAKQACRDIPALDVSAATNEAEMRALYLAEWRRIKDLVPVGIRAAFMAVLA